MAVHALILKRSLLITELGVQSKELLRGSCSCLKPVLAEKLTIKGERIMSMAEECCGAHL